jgi:hypothetical protein
MRMNDVFEDSLKGIEFTSMNLNEISFNLDFWNKYDLSHTFISISEEECAVITEAFEKVLKSPDEDIRRLEGVTFLAHWRFVVDDADVGITGDKAIPLYWLMLLYVNDQKHMMDLDNVVDVYQVVAGYDVAMHDIRQYMMV